MTIIEKFLLRLKSVLNWLMLLEKAYDYLILIKSGSLRFRAMYLLVIENLQGLIFPATLRWDNTSIWDQYGFAFKVYEINIWIILLLPEMDQYRK